jgi:hypothetical protein
MKTIVKMILPVAAFVLASAGAVSTNAKQENKAETTLINGWIRTPDAQHCTEVFNLDCTTVSGTPVCMTTEATPKQVYNKNAASQCSVNLFKVLN